MTTFRKQVGHSSCPPLLIESAVMCCPHTGHANFTSLMALWPSVSYREESDNSFLAAHWGLLALGVVESAGDRGAVFEGVSGAGMFIVEDDERIFVHGGIGFIDLALGCKDRFEIESELLCHEPIHAFALGWAVIVSFGREVDILKLSSGVVQLINTLNVGELDLRNVPGPIFAIGDDALRLRSKKRGNFSIVGVVGIAVMNGQAALALATAKEMGGNHDHGHADFHASVSRAEEERLRAAAGFAGAADALGIDVRHGEQKIESTHAVPKLKGEDVWVVVFGLGGVADADHVIREGNRAHAGEESRAGLGGGVETRTSAMAVRTDDSGERSFAFGRTIEVSADEKAGEAFEGDVFDGIAFAGLFAPDDRFQAAARWEWGQVRFAENGFTNVLGASFPVSAGVPGFAERFELGLALFFGLARLFHRERCGQGKKGRGENEDKKWSGKRFHGDSLAQWEGASIR